ncbi:polysaccharide biosynthesis/export family protein [Acetobacter thailandicus]|uniref:polysaccharide biosynthesis/export family protein n=1 Tax=Acetobacter thailandicus TaxID=1502842 RepID=UPI001BA92345|nr:polysaccharide biosynthesis/export family protein [Acetobacter thailandicus]MBS0986933.1 polysaccharide biosynthesis/export family protein [Acetobacter thailandicus]
MKKNVFFIYVFSVSLLLSGCALPNAGPLAGKILKTNDIKVVDVTPALAEQMIQTAKAQQQNKINATLAALAHTDRVTDYRLSPGDTIQINLWTMSPWPGQENSSSGSDTNPAPISLGNFELDTHGNISLPYANQLHLSGNTEAEAEQAINQRYNSLKILQSPASSVTIHGSLKDSILVTGAIGKPSILPWNAGGMTMAEALTEAMGSGLSIEAKETASPGQETSETVTIYRKQQACLSLPMVSALENNIALQPGDKLIVHSRSAVKATVLGGGIFMPGSYGFGEIPSLAEVIAKAHGLNPDTANANHIFVFRQEANTSPVLYNFKFNGSAGMMALQKFPIADQDIVYVAESALIPISHVLNTIFEMALPATMAR